MFVRAGIVIRTVSKMTLISLFFLIYLNILEMRIARMKETEAPKSKPITIEIVVEIMVERTIKKSKLFPVSLK